MQLQTQKQTHTYMQKDGADTFFFFITIKPRIE